MLNRIAGAEAAIQETYSTFRAEFEGHRAADNELEDILRTSVDSSRVAAAWEARKQIGPAVPDDLRQRAPLRNGPARALGFQDYWHSQLLLDELDPDELIDILDEVER